MKSNTRGFVSVREGDPCRTRGSRRFSSTTPTTAYLDEQGFAPFGQVVSGMEIVDKLFGYPRENEPDQRRILRDGNEYLLKEFPKLDVVKKATIVPAAPARRRPS